MLCFLMRYSRFGILFLLFLQISQTPLAAAGYIRHQEPDFLTFEELKTLSKNPHPGGALESKLERFFKTPEINNEAYYRGVRPKDPKDPRLGRVLTVASWNIEKSYHVENALKIFNSPSDFAGLLDPDKVDPVSGSYKKILRQRQRLEQADVLILQEMDIGHKRSGYLHAAKTLAEGLGMNYAYGAEQLEIDPVYLGTEEIQKSTGERDADMTEYFATDPSRYKGVFGSAVLSRYPIKHVEVFQLKEQPYDWYAGETGKPALVEKSRRLGTKLLFKNEITRELKVGGRIYFRVDLDIPELPGKTLTVINIHLEIKCQPKGRENQMREILSYIQDIHHPVIVMGDFNAASEDLSSTSMTRIVKRSAKNPATWLNAAVTFLTPYGPVNLARNAANETLNFQDPFSKNIKIVAPNSLKPLFEMIESFRFKDGGAFDFRGDRKKSIHGKHKKLSNSNERDFKGFKTTFRVKRPIGPILGKLRLDWVFVKSFLTSPQGPGPYRFAPHFGETLEELNTGLKEPISDHHPNVVDLPFEEPKN